MPHVCQGMSLRKYGYLKKRFSYLSTTLSRPIDVVDLRANKQKRIFLSYPRCALMRQLLTIKTTLWVIFLASFYTSRAGVSTSRKETLPSPLVEAAIDLSKFFTDFLQSRVRRVRTVPFARRGLYKKLVIRNHSTILNYDLCISELTPTFLANYKPIRNEALVIWCRLLDQSLT